MRIKEAIPLEFSEVYNFSEGLALVCRDDTWGFIDKTGAMKLSYKKYRSPYGYSTGFHDGLAVVGKKNNEKFGFIDTSGNEVIQLKFDAIREFSCGNAIVGVADKNLGYDSYGAPGCKWGSINKNGDEIIMIGKYKSVGCYGELAHNRDNPGGVDSISDYTERKFYEGITSVSAWDSGNYGFVDNLGKEIVPPIYHGIKRFSNGMASVEDIKNQKAGSSEIMAAVIDKMGEIVIPFKYQWIDCFYDGITIAGNRNPFETFFIDKNGNQPFPLKYSGACAFHEGMAEVYNEITGMPHKYGFIDSNGQEIIPCKYDYVMPYYDGIAIVGLGNYYEGKKGAVDKQGREFIPCIYDNVKLLGHGLVAVQVDDKWIIFDRLGNEVVRLVYDYIDSFCEGMAEVRIKDKCGFIKIEE